MNYIFLTVLLIFSIFKNEMHAEYAQDIKDFKIIDFPTFEAMTSKNSGKIRIFNFWATWCAPCIREMPYFEKIHAEDEDIEVIFISMDDGRKPERVMNFIEKRNIKSPVYLLDEVDFNSWIEKVDPEWSGAIPATLFIQPNGERSFFEGELTYDELKSMISQLK
jgi:thiol-disulfide isomerase/thioredoxin